MAYQSDEFADFPRVAEALWLDLIRRPHWTKVAWWEKRGKAFALCIGSGLLMWVLIATRNPVLMVSSLLPLVIWVGATIYLAHHRRGDMQEYQQMRIREIANVRPGFEQFYSDWSNAQRKNIQRTVSFGVIGVILGTLLTGFRAGMDDEMRRK